MSNTAINLFANCSLDTLSSGGDNNLAMLQCMSNQFDTIQQNITNDQYQQRNWLFVTCGALVLFMQAGFAMIVGGCVRKKNLQNTMLKNLLDCCGAAIAFWSIGYAFAYGGDTTYDGTSFIGNANFFGLNMNNNNTNLTADGFWFFQFAFCSTAVTIVAGTLAERCQMGAYLCYSLFLSGFVYPVVAHNVWSAHGIFSAFLPNVTDRYRGVGCIDFAGSGVVHLTGGTIALIAAYILGPRVGRFYDALGQKLDKPAEFKGHSIALQMLGTLVLWFGWYGFNPGSALVLSYADPGSLGAIAAKSAANTSLSAASGALSGMTIYYLRERFFRSGSSSFNITMTMNGCLSGLVAITAGSASVDLWESCVIGAIGGMIYVYGSGFVVYLMIDDAVDAIPVHMFNGIWGLIAAGLFSTPDGIKNAFGQDNIHFGWFYNMSDATLFLNQIVLVCFIFAWTCGTMVPFFLGLNYLGWFRSDGLEEVIGLDVRYHGGTNEINDKELQQDLEQYKDMIMKQRTIQAQSTTRSQLGTTNATANTTGSQSQPLVS